MLSSALLRQQRTAQEKHWNVGIVTSRRICNNCVNGHYSCASEGVRKYKFEERNYFHLRARYKYLDETLRFQHEDFKSNLTGDNRRGLAE